MLKMISYHKGNLLESGCDIICHQVNLDGVMGGGIAFQIAQKYPIVEEMYKKYCRNVSIDNLGGDVCYVPRYGYDSDVKKYVANCFSQNNDFTTNYEWLFDCVVDVRKLAEKKRLETVGIPKNYGCGIAKGDWETVKAIWESEFKDCDIDLQIWEL